MPKRSPTEKPVLPPTVAYSVAVVVALCVAWWDRSTGESFSLRLLYVPLVVFVGWRGGAWVSVLLAAAISLGWLASMTLPDEVIRYTTPRLWEAGCRFGLLAIAGVLASRLRTSAKREQAAAERDPLTDLPNKKAFDRRLDEEWNRCRRIGHPLTIAFLDCDDFKSINDTRGHLVGDDMLQTLAKSLRAGTRNYDLPARLGGDEFGLILPETDAAAAQVVIERLRTLLREAMPDGENAMTVSLGVVTFLTLPENAQDMVGQADETMLATKRQGKNAVGYEIVE
jgi:diguanylate cyclase (GGDEF)-like protein